jgi:tripartite-type tricarboxylate transporter receptor subunit TctC
MQQGRLRYLMQLGHAMRWKGLPDVPTARELAKRADDKTLLELAEAPFLMSRPFFAPPDIPPPQAAALVQAFMRTQEDADYLREASEMQLDISPLAGAQMQALMLNIARTPPDVIARYKAAVGAS